MGLDISNYSSGGITKEELNEIKTQLKEEIKGKNSDEANKIVEQAQNEINNINSAAGKEKVELSITSGQINSKGLDNPSSFNFNVENKKAQREIVITSNLKSPPVTDPGTVTFPDRNTGYQRNYIGPFDSLSDAQQFGWESMHRPFNSLSENGQKLFLQVTNGTNALIYENKKDGKFYIPFGQPTENDVPKHFELADEITKPW